MKLSNQQSAALDAVHRWYRAGAHGSFKVFGPAGSGKSTLAQYFGEGIDKVAYACFTGKAAHVLHTKGCKGARTIHSLIYLVEEKSRVELKKLEDAYDEACEQENTYLEQRLKKDIVALKKDLSSPSFTINPNASIRDYDLVIIDECSMIDERLGTDLESYGVPLLVLGDPNQLPPVKGRPHFTPSPPDILLTEIHRQALDSGIIRFATDIRNGVPVYTTGHYGDDVTFYTANEFAETVRADIRPSTQVIVGRNKTRHRANDILRDLQGRTSAYPEAGDRVICLKNNPENGILNGEQFFVMGCYQGDDSYLHMALVANKTPLSIKAHQEIFRREEVPITYIKEADHMDWANAITCHKAQGSEYEDVVVIDESRAFHEKSRKWKYTAATRASKHLTWVCP